MDCVTPSHPHKIPHGESLDINTLLDKGPEAFLNPSIKPISPPDPDKYSYTPRKPVMSSLQTSDNPAFIKAQITSDDKELREIIKEALKSNSTSASSTAHSRKPTTKAPVQPVAAEPQKARLMNVQSGLYADFRNQSQRNKQPNFPLPKYVPKPRPSAGI